MDILEFGQWLQVESDWTVVVREPNQVNNCLDNMELEEFNDLMCQGCGKDINEGGEDDILEASLHNLTLDSIHSPFPKKINCSTPLKEHSGHAEIPFEKTDSRSTNAHLDEMISILPNVLEHMKITLPLWFKSRRDFGFFAYEESIKLAYGWSLVLVRCPLVSKMINKGSPEVYQNQ
jgi:hypothetical protein